MARPREFDEDKVVDALMGVFWTKGYESAALSDIMEATGLGKGSLYAAFGDKRAMYLKALTEYEARYVDELVGAMAEMPADEAIATLLGLATKAAEEQDFRGCFLCNASLEILAFDTATRDALSAANQKLTLAIRKAWLDLRGLSRSDDADTAANQILAFYFGLRILAKSGVSADQVQAAANSYCLP